MYNRVLAAIYPPVFASFFFVDLASMADSGDSFEGAPAGPPGDTLAPGQGQGDAFVNPTVDGLDKGKGLAKGKGPAE